jgi:hypothetical protein
MGIYQWQDFEEAVIVLRPIHDAELDTLEHARRVVDADRQSDLRPADAIVDAD